MFYRTAALALLLCGPANAQGIDLENPDARLICHEALTISNSRLDGRQVEARACLAACRTRLSIPDPNSVAWAFCVTLRDLNRRANRPGWFSFQ